MEAKNARATSPVRSSRATRNDSPDPAPSLDQARSTLELALLDLGSRPDFSERLVDTAPELDRLVQRLDAERTRLTEACRKLLSGWFDSPGLQTLRRTKSLLSELRDLNREEGDALFYSLCVDVGCGD
ncbi:MAG: hypothetical protein HYV07_02560 [Deltaproteobacteria bacterium]|nr:hypothetical protein [Deltaproteobacteria bacterium]